MPVFEYKALDRKGKKAGGLITADGPVAARQKLTQDQLFPTEIREVRTVARASVPQTFLARLLLHRRVNPMEVTTAFRQLATLVSSGLPLLECLNGLIEQTEHTQLRRIFTQIREKVVEGGSLSQAMADHPSVFSHVHINMVRAGETGGALDLILKRLADFSEKGMKLRKKLEAAMAYPTFLLMISTVILIFIMSFVMPKVIGIFKGMEMTLPWSTRALIGMTHFMKRFWWLVALGLAASAALIAVWVKTERGHRVWDRMRLRIPLLGTLHHRSVIARFTRTLSTLLGSGIPVVDSLEIARLSMGNRIMEEAVKEAAKVVAEGADLTTPLRKTGRFPPLVTQLVRAGEQSGNLEDMLAKAAEVYEEDVDSSIAALTAVVEPMVILFMGLMVAYMVMAVLLPIFDMTSGIK